MIGTSALTDHLLDLALQRNLPAFQQSLKRTLEHFNLAAWAAVFRSSSEIGSRPVLIAHGIRPNAGPLLTQASRDGLDAVIPRQGSENRMLRALAQEMSPEPGSHCHILRSKQERGGEFILFCYRASGAAAFTPGELDVLGQVGRVLDRCFLAVVETQEHDFQNGLFRIVANLHPEGLCVLDNRLRVVFENRKFREHMHLWNHGVAGLQNLTLPKQSELPDDWRGACDKSFRAFREVKLPHASGKMVVTQGSVLTLKKRFDTYGTLEGDVRYLAFQSAVGVRAFLLLTSIYRREDSRRGSLPLAKIATSLKFSRRETELAELILRGSSVREIADQLRIAVPTVKTHIRHILHKAGVRTRLQFVGLCRGAEEG